MFRRAVPAAVLRCAAKNNSGGGGGGGAGPSTPRSLTTELRASTLPSFRSEPTDAILGTPPSPDSRNPQLRRAVPKRRTQFQFKSLMTRDDPAEVARLDQAVADFEAQQQLDFYHANPLAPLNVRGVQDRTPNIFVDGSGVRTLDPCVDLPKGKDMLPLSRHYPRRAPAWAPEINGEAQPFKGTVAVVGGGVVGCATAMLFALRGYEVNVFERRAPLDDAQIAAAPAEYTLLTRRALDVLERAGVPLSDLRSMGVKVEGILEHPGAHHSPLSAGLIEEHRFAVNMLSIDLNRLRAHLERHLRTAPGGAARIIHNRLVVGVRVEERTLMIESLERANGEAKVAAQDLDEHTKQRQHPDVRSPEEAPVHLQYDMLVVADGATSQTRQHLMVPTHVFDESMGVRWFRVRSEKLERNYIHRWAGPMVGNQMSLVLAFPAVEEGWFSVMFYAPAEELNSCGWPLLREKYCATLDGELVPSGGEKARPHPTIFMEHLCNSHAFPTAVLVGDAAHAISPFLMQGLSCALEDASVLLSNIDQLQLPSTFDRIRQYSFQRGPSSDRLRAIQERSIYYARRKHWSPLLRLRNWYTFVMNRQIPAYKNEKFFGSTNYRYPRSVEEMMHGKGYTSYDMIDAAQHRVNWWVWFGRLYT